jgi:hypothetical protein
MQGDYTGTDDNVDVIAISAGATFSYMMPGVIRKIGAGSRKDHPLGSMGEADVSVR